MRASWMVRENVALLLLVCGILWWQGASGCVCLGSDVIRGEKAQSDGFCRNFLVQADGNLTDYGEPARWACEGGEGTDGGAELHPEVPEEQDTEAQPNEYLLCGVEGKSCPRGSICHKQLCFRPAVNGECPPRYSRPVLVEGTQLCLPKVCTDSGDCEKESLCIRGLCIDRCDGVSCAETHSCVLGACVYDVVKAKSLEARNVPCEQLAQRLEAFLRREQTCKKDRDCRINYGTGCGWVVSSSLRPVQLAYLERFRVCKLDVPNGGCTEGLSLASPRCVCGGCVADLVHRVCMMP